MNLPRQPRRCMPTVVSGQPCIFSNIDRATFKPYYISLGRSNSAWEGNITWHGSEWHRSRDSCNKDWSTETSWSSHGSSCHDSAWGHHGLLYLPIGFRPHPKHGSPRQARSRGEGERQFVGTFDRHLHWHWHRHRWNSSNERSHVRVTCGVF